MRYRRSLWRLWGSVSCIGVGNITWRCIRRMWSRRSWWGLRRKWYWESKGVKPCWWIRRRRWYWRYSMGRSRRWVCMPPPSYSFSNISRHRSGWIQPNPSRSPNSSKNTVATPSPVRCPYDPIYHIYSITIPLSPPYPYISPPIILWFISLSSQMNSHKDELM